MAQVKGFDHVIRVSVDFDFIKKETILDGPDLIK